VRCKRKVRYPMQVDAQLALFKLSRQDKPEHLENRAYQCPHCKGWHLTSQPLKEESS
jgi:hypothetical protein